MLTANSRDDEKDPTLPYLRRYACPSLRRNALQPCFSRAPYTVVTFAGYRKIPLRRTHIIDDDNNAACRVLQNVRAASQLFRAIVEETCRFLSPAVLQSFTLWHIRLGVVDVASC